MQAPSGPHAPTTRRRLRLAVACFALLLATSAALIAAGSVPSAGAASGAAAVASPTPQASPRAFVKHPQAVPILVYHHVQSYKAGYYLIYVGTAQFASQLSYLHHNGYHPVTLRRVYDAWTGRAKLPRRPVVLSFDDGYRSDWRAAAPILQRIGWPGVLNLCMNAVHAHGDLPVPLVHGLVRAGWEIDDHTLTHPDLTTLDAAGLHREIVVSRAVLQALSGEPVSFFCYPSGRYDATVVAAVKAAGFVGATTTDVGLATPTDLFTLARVRVHRAMSLAAFAHSLAH